jgi:hypothetical protein
MKKITTTSKYHPQRYLVIYWNKIVAIRSTLSAFLHQTINGAQLNLIQKVEEGMNLCKPDPTNTKHIKTKDNEESNLYRHQNLPASHYGYK